MPYSYTNEAVDYKYIVTDLLSDKILAEIPFEGVSFTRALRDAGSFSGSIPVIPDNDYLDLYETTLPAKTALYILRNGVCVWGGIIWSRTYNIITRTLDVNASEFTSYFSRRVAWKTWNQEYNVKVSTTSTANQLKIDVVGGGFPFTAAMPIQLNMQADFNKLSNFYTINASPTPNAITCYVTADSEALNSATLTDEPATINVQVDTYDYLRKLVEYLNFDFSEIDFPNTEIAPEYNIFSDITNYSRASSTATITLSNPHTIVPGQIVTISGVPSPGFSGKKEVLSVPSDTTFTYQSLGVNLATQTVTGTEKQITRLSVTKVSTESLVHDVKMTLSSTHSALVGDIVVVADVERDLDGTHIITAVTSNTITYQTVAVRARVEEEESGTASVGPKAEYSSYGSYTKNSNIGIVVKTPNDATYSAKFIPTATLRGSDLTNLGEHLEKYSNTVDGFEYRVDCAYTQSTNRFSKTLVVLPLDPFSVLTPEELEALGGPPYDLTVFGAEKLVFEHPGNILEATMEENTNDAATRFWVQGQNEDGVNSSAGDPYAGVAMSSMLADGWPILDEVETYDSDDEYVLAEYATRYLEESTPPLSNFAVTVNGSVTPVVGSYSPGDWCSVIIDDAFVQLRMASGLEPRDQVLVRKIDSYTVKVPASPTYPETVELQLIRESQVDKLGN